MACWREQALGDLSLHFSGQERVTDYMRELDLDSAIAGVSYVSGGARFHREIFSSAIDQVIELKPTNLSVKAPTQHSSASMRHFNQREHLRGEVVKKRSVCVILLSIILLTAFNRSLPAQDQAGPRKSIYHTGWIDLNKNGRLDVYEDPQAPIEKRIDDLLRQMNLDEKTCQTATLYGVGRGRTGLEPPMKDELPTPEWKQRLWKDGIANIDEHLNGVGPNGKSVYATDIKKHVWAMNEVQRFFIEQTRLGIPVDFTNEGLRGLAFSTATSFPSELGQGHTWDKELISEIGRITADEARALGYTNIYAPTLDVSRDQRWGRIEDTYGEDPYLVSRLGVAMAKAMQKNYQVASTAKHFAVYSIAKGAREGQARTDPQATLHEVENIFLPPFKAAFKEAGILGVMSSYNDYDG
ncbi:MAG TPA: glycoside hydrolase family 3 N-terminal domain-containing protein, partial [Blastocatellia bacterium]|nr:glycoside hydrolase family 3 N-terminal domain-containing protein [Blastocatellia bacterium]